MYTVEIHLTTTSIKGKHIQLVIVEFYILKFKPPLIQTYYLGIEKIGVSL